MDALVECSVPMVGRRIVRYSGADVDDACFHAMPTAFMVDVLKSTNTTLRKINKAVPVDPALLFWVQ